jgi:broad specificity phosphatase PhoE
MPPIVNPSEKASSAMLTSANCRSLARRVLLVRHAESTAQVAGAVTTSHGLIPLTEFGRRQATAFANSVATAPALIVSSPFVRALETAEPLRARYPAVPFETWPVQEFTFLDPAKCAMTSLDQRRAQRRAYRNRNDPVDRDGNDAESFNDFVQRAVDFLERARTLPSGTTYVFTHSFFMRLVEMVLESRPTDSNAFMRKYYAEVGRHIIGNLGIVALPQTSFESHHSM